MLRVSGLQMSKLTNVIRPNFGQRNERLELADERYSWSRCERYIGNSPRMCSPVHCAGDHTTVAKNPFNESNMPETVCSLRPGLQVYDSPGGRLVGNSPVKLVCPKFPLPGISASSPWYKDTM